MKPDYQLAATKAAETLIKFGINSAPIDPLPILKKIPGVLVVSYQEMSDDVEQDRQCVIDMFGEKNQDAFTSVKVKEENKHYIVTYNQKLSQVLVLRAFARELGHIILGHDGSRPEEVRNEEAKCFAHHLLVPRPLIHMIQVSGLRLTEEVLGNLTGCYHYCLSCIRKTPAVSVSPDLNRLVRDQFKPYFMNFFEFQRYAEHKDGSPVADLGTFMDNYEE